MLYVSLLLQILVTQNVVHIPPNILILFSVNKNNYFLLSSIDMLKERKENNRFSACNVSCSKFTSEPWLQKVFSNHWHLQVVFKGYFFLLCCFGNLFMIIKFTIILIFKPSLCDEFARQVWCHQTYLIKSSCNKYWLNCCKMS